MKFAKLTKAQVIRRLILLGCVLAGGFAVLCIRSNPH